ncbi:MAG: hypothetical protein HYY95_07035 [Candidatus Rokubacteria bacterium]|nr:hypothetical protein [Candidatus Rokubacteria bacterium]MBI3105312.1 hypothetical protein [Candidatus Rokubacteria bacterium]
MTTMPTVAALWLTSPRTSPPTRTLLPERPSAALASPAAAETWHAAILGFKRGLIAGALRQSGGNRTRAARTLGLQRTYLLRLMRDFGITGPR